MCFCWNNTRPPRPCHMYGKPLNPACSSLQSHEPRFLHSLIRKRIRHTTPFGVVNSSYYTRHSQSYHVMWSATSRDTISGRPLQHHDSEGLFRNTRQVCDGPSSVRALTWQNSSVQICRHGVNNLGCPSRPLLKSQFGESVFIRVAGAIIFGFHVHLFGKPSATF